MTLRGNRIVLLLFALLGVLDFIYGMIKSDMISLGMGSLLVVISLYVFKKETSSAPDKH